MALNSANAVTSAIAAGQQYKTSWYKAFSVTTGVAANWYDTWTYAGMPSAGTLATGSLGTGYPMFGSPGASYNTGRISCGENVASYSWNKHLFNAEFMVSAAATAMPMWVMLVDMLVYYPAIVSSTTTAQTVNTTPTAYLTTAGRYTTGAGVMMYLTPTTATTPAIATVTVTYTNSSGTSHASPTVSITSSNVGAIGALMLAGPNAGNSGPFIPLYAGDTGVRYPTAITISATQGAGPVTLVQCYPLATFPVMAGPSNTIVATAKDFLFNSPTMPRIYDGACLNMLLYTSGAVVASTPLYGMLDFVWG